MWQYDYPNGNGSNTVVTRTEDQIIDEYYFEWCDKMRRLGKDKMISKENCIKDWITDNFAYWVNDVYR